MGKWVWYAASVFFGVIPLRMIPAVVNCIGWLCGLLPLSYKAGIVQNRLRIGLPDNKGYAKAVTRSFVWYLAEFFAFHRITDLKIEYEGEAYLQSMLRGTKGAIMVTGHIGNWELGAHALSRRGFKMSAVALRHGSPIVDGVYDRQRDRSQVSIIELGQSARQKAMDVLKSGSYLGIVGDRDFSGRTHPVKVGQGTLQFPTGPAFLSVQADVPLVPMFLVREGDWQFRLCMGKPIDPSEWSDKSAAVPLMTEAFAREFEKVLFRYPEQWLVFESLVERP